MPEPTWQASLHFLRQLREVPAAQANAITLTQAHHRWQQAVIARTSTHDLLFTLPGDAHPFKASVLVQNSGSQHTLFRWDHEMLVEHTVTDVDHIDATLDSFLEHLTAPTLTCRYCGHPVVVAAHDFETFERMHYNCFHYLFEHRPFDPDEECTAGGCPSANIGPNQRREEPRDSLVEELIDDLMMSDLGTRSAEVRISREGPGTVSAAFDTDRYLITVRTEPQPR